MLFDFLKATIVWRIQHPEDDIHTKGPQIKLESLGASLLGSYINEQGFSKEESLVLILGITPHLIPNFLQDVITETFPNGTDLPQFGGVKGQYHRGILPTGETALFLLGGTNILKRIKFQNLFNEAHQLYRNRVLFLSNVPAGEPEMSGKIVLFEDTLHLLTTGAIPLPKRTANFPAEKLETGLGWEDLILSNKTLSHIKELEIWLAHNDTLLKKWGMESRIKPGYRVLFHGPPGTGKTLTASLLGKYTNKPVYRIDLSTVVSKYIGETEKNLASLFDKAATKNWILFFDEADAIFGKRTSVRDAHDKYANQEVSYLLQRVETHPGLVILASNFKDNIDDSFTRRFQSIVLFEMPGASERKRLWETNLPKALTLGPDINLEMLSRKYELTGSNILNIIHYCSLHVLNNKSTTLTLPILIAGIKKEFLKEDRMF
ncbi:AAA family ATPase [Cochleicola gelatinilyticus]|uniref:AAA family ATPase n=2 Tax=Cochleicola gelatinilyticus TaxID=1763537 RepID=A0A167HVS3_9FLAO|nr:AAA family ATPase [Cochleicola gelatinilyticus]